MCAAVHDTTRQKFEHSSDAEECNCWQNLSLSWMRTGFAGGWEKMHHQSGAVLQAQISRHLQCIENWCTAAEALLDIVVKSTAAQAETNNAVDCWLFYCTAVVCTTEFFAWNPATTSPNVIRCAVHVIFMYKEVQQVRCTVPREIFRTSLRRSVILLHSSTPKGLDK